MATTNPLRSADSAYVAAVVATYTSVPGTPERASRQDRRLARDLEQRGVPLDAVQVAILIGAARRSFRARDRPPLPLVRTLHYFLPVVEEVLAEPPAPGYVGYLRTKLALLVRNAR